MAPKILTALSALVLLAATAVHAEPQIINAVFSSGEFSGLGGSGHSAGFALIDQDGTTIYEESYPGDHTPCQQYDGRTFTVDMGCFVQTRTFNCKADFGGKPEHCSITGADGNLVMEADGTSDTKFNGISVGIDAACVVQFQFKPGEHCDADQTDVTIT